MGGTKKRSLSATSKAQTESASGESATRRKKDEKGKGQTQQKAKIVVLLDEKQGLNALAGLKAITSQALARNTGVKISVANAFLKSLESKGSIRYVGGYSGHKVYQLVQEAGSKT